MQYTQYWSTSNHSLFFSWWNVSVINFLYRGTVYLLYCIMWTYVIIGTSKQVEILSKLLNFCLTTTVQWHRWQISLLSGLFLEVSLVKHCSCHWSMVNDISGGFHVNFTDFTISTEQSTLMVSLHVHGSVFKKSPCSKPNFSGSLLFVFRYKILDGAW